MVLKSNSYKTLLFYQPPEISYEMRGSAEIHEEGSVYHRLINAQHDVYHQPHVESWMNRPAYIFIIEEIYDNSSTEDGFGNRIWDKFCRDENIGNWNQKQ